MDKCYYSPKRTVTMEEFKEMFDVKDDDHLINEEDILLDKPPVLEFDIITLHSLCDMGE